MSQKGENTMGVIIRSPSSLLEEAVFECPDLTWNQVFCEPERMSRAGQVLPAMKGLGLYAVSRQPHATPPCKEKKGEMGSCNQTS
jgi:hypothetical protein